MGDISKHFSRHEFRCKCSNNCGFEAVDIELIKILEKVRAHFGEPIIVHCGCRCIQHNRSIGSKDTSKHTKGIACDFHIKGILPDIINAYLEAIMADWGGLGVYDTFNHIDVRSTKARWDSRGHNGIV